MVKKKFIDKKKSVTYNLVYRSTEDADDTPKRVLIESDRPAEAIDVEAAADARQDSRRRYPPGHPLAWLEDEEQQDEMSDARRRELVELGFPDDGYDYLRHVRTLGHGSASMEGMPGLGGAGERPRGTSAETGPVGPSVFVPASSVRSPEEDVLLYDASKLTVLQTEQEEEAVEGMLGGVTAFSRPKDVAQGADGKELEELEAIMAALEEETRSEDGAIEGEGDLLDDFVLAATEGAAGAADDWESDDDDEEDVGCESWSGSDYDSEKCEELDDGGLEPNRTGRGPARPGSIASTYWRDERTDRRNLLGVIDEGFEHLALEYDEDEIGELDDAAEMGEIQGFADVSSFDPALDEFLQQRGAAVDAVKGPRVNSFLKEEMEAHGFSDDDADVAINAARQCIRQAEEDEANGVSGSRQADMRMDVIVDDPSKHWDCESVLSFKSNLYNHPGTITEPTSSRRPGVIRLDKNGMPMGVLSRRETAAKRMMPPPVQDPVAVATPPLERKKGESSDEKKARKNAVKEAKREARAAKKELKTMYKEESVKAQRRVATAHVQPAIVL